MQLSKDSRLCRFAYFHNKLWADINDRKFYLPRQTNLCRFFWRVVLLAPACLVGIGGICLFFVAILSLIFFSGILAIPFGYRPNPPWKWDKRDEVTVSPWGRIRNWPTWLTFRGHRILPGAVVLISTAIFFLGWVALILSQLLWQWWTSLASGQPVAVYSTSGTLAVLGIVALAIFWFKVVKGSEFHLMCKEFFRNKVKGNICPIITFVESPSNGETQTG